MNIASFIIYCVVVTFTPGPTNIVILSSVEQHGARKAMEYVWGATLAFGLLLAASAFLNRMLAGVIPDILAVMQIVGSIYMLYLAYQICRMGRTEDRAVQNASFAAGLIMQFINPKVLMFTLTVIPSYVLPYYTSSSVSFLFVLIITGIGFLAFVTWVVCGSVFRRFLHQQHRLINILMALFLVYSAVMASGIL